MELRTQPIYVCVKNINIVGSRTMPWRAGTTWISRYMYTDEVLLKKVKWIEIYLFFEKVMFTYIYIYI